jgi:hypothetical protein
MIVIMSRRSSILAQIQNKPVHTSQIKKSNSLLIDQEIECHGCHNMLLRTIIKSDLKTLGQFLLNW